MTEEALRALLKQVRAGALHPDDAVAQLARLPFADLGHARVDHHRALRQGLPEAVYAPGKSVDQCAAIVAELLAHGHGAPVVLSRASGSQADACERHSGPADHRVPTGADRYTLVWRPGEPRCEHVIVVSAGTADAPVVEECAITLRAYGITPVVLRDCGVAGIHRLLVHADELRAADAIVVVAGMEGALASVVGGLSGAPIVAVPTSTGYGAALEGVTALLAMLSSCAAGLTVVGIDNGYGAAVAVARILGSRTGAR